MDRKKQILVSDSDPDIDLKFLIHQHSLFSDSSLLRCIYPFMRKRSRGFMALARMQNLEKEKSNSESDEVEINPMVSGLENDEHSVRYEELRQRLHRKIEDLEEVEIAVSQRRRRRRRIHGKQQQVELQELRFMMIQSF
ncbi:hypothetical protein SADUNF_Sadunf08G0143000 [Salix dunnii]|uniref:Uncharacterized protein n=1 Tax=Salix dunnii TaxID=1413687 RepID=A0A835MV13_9ROSI|nr:hypothetical protein SADUNF_Sadunf08G0143000 [Salix dunnii]